jgi:hypothetical protein
MRRHRPNPYTSAPTPRYIVLWSLQWQVVECTKLDPGADLHHAMTTTIARLQLDGWQPESDANHGFVFMNRNGERRLLMLTARDPEERGPQTFSPFR